MPILVMALLALVVFGLIGILLIVAVILEHSTPASSAKSDAPQPLAPGAVPFLIPNFEPPRGKDTPPGTSSSKEKVHEHACTG